MKNEIDNFEILDDQVLVHSKSGHTYSIRKNFCSCKGFGFHRTCRHYKEAEQQGLIQLLTDKKRTVNITLSQHIKSMRQDALRHFLKKRGIKFTEKQILSIEPKISQKTRPEDVTKMIGSY